MRIVTVFVLMLMLCSLAGADIYDVPDAKAKGGVCGKIEPAKDLQAVVVIEPTEFKAYLAKLDAAGSFSIRGLPPGEYDLMIKRVGHVYEGLTLTVAPDPDAGPSREPTPDELKAICDGVAQTFITSEDYFNAKRIVRLTGSGDRARMFVMQTRTRAVVDPAGNAVKAWIRRFDIVQMVKTVKVWQLDTHKHLMRYEVPLGSPDQTVEFTHSPALGGILVGEQVKDLGTIDLAKLPPSKAKYASREMEAR